MEYFEYNGMIFFREKDLAHHGIKGQRWGKLNGPPYPLDYKDHSAKEKKLNPKKNISAGDEKSSGKKKSSDEIAKPKKKNGEQLTNKKDISETQTVIKKGSLTGDKIYSLSHDDFNRELLKRNPNAAVANPSILDWAKAHKKQIAIAAGVTVAAAASIGYLYYKKKFGGPAPTPINPVLNTPVNQVKLPPEKIGKIEDLIDKANGAVPDGNSDLRGFSSKSERFLKQWLAADVHRYDPISKSEYLKMAADDGVSLPVGQQMFRLSKHSHSSLRDGIEYVSFTNEDRKRYLGFLPQMWSYGYIARRRYFEAALEASEAIKAPSKKETIDIMVAALKKFSPGHTDAEYLDDVLRNFYKYSIEMIDRSGQFNVRVIKELKARGFNAMIDFNDAGRLSDKPLILLNGAKSAKITGITKWLYDDLYKIFKNLNLPKNVVNFSVDDYINKLTDQFSTLSPDLRQHKVEEMLHRYQEAVEVFLKYNYA